MVFNSSSHGERRQLTVMFADIVGSTEISAQLDPEDWHDIVTQYHHTATSAVKRMDGHVEQYLGMAFSFCLVSLKRTKMTPSAPSAAVCCCSTI